MENLIEGLQREMNRVREMIQEYEALPKNAGALAVMFMRVDIKRAEEAIAQGDIIQMLVLYEELKKYES